MTWKKHSLRSKVLVVVIVLVATTFSGGLLTIWYAHEVDSFINTTIERDLAGAKSAVNLETSLLMQKGLVTYFSLDRNVDWLKQLAEQQLLFVNWLKRARDSTLGGDQLNLITRIEQEYAECVLLRDRTIQLYQEGKREEAESLHRETRSKFNSVFELCQSFMAGYERSILRAKAQSQSRAHTINILAIIGTMGVAALGAVLAYTLVRHILEPIRRLVTEGNVVTQDASLENEVIALKQKFDTLIEDADETRTMLEQSQEHLVHSEKWAMVGKLAAGMAHSIRNPLTSVQMRIFSLSRGRALSENEKEDFEVIAEEISHIDTIVQNFLEFSRPPKFTTRKISMSDVVDTAVRLLKHRLESSKVRLEIVREMWLPESELDPEQMREALVNLLVNACEAMNEGGMIVIHEDVVVEEPQKPVLIVTLRDNGPGIPHSIQEKIFQPFFTTKGEGTGLGLAIASRIVEGHGGKLEVSSGEGEGATFTITLPIT